MKKMFLILATATTVFAQSMCEEYCGTCAVDSSDPSCERISKICGCAIAPKASASTSLTDSNSENDPTSTAEGALMNSDETVPAENVPTTSAEPSAENSNELVQETSTSDSAENIPAALAPEHSQDSEISPDENTAPAENSVAQASPEDKPRETAPESDSGTKLFRLGAGAGFRTFEPKSYGKIHYDHYNQGYGGALRFVAQWTPIQYVSLQTGLDVSIYYADMGESERTYMYNSVEGSAIISYTTLYFEIPLSVRLKLPLGKYATPFISYTFGIRHPEYEWGSYDYYYYNSNGNNILDDEHSHSGFFEGIDWEFSHLIGFGVEIARHFSLEMSFSMLEFDSGSGEIHDYSDNSEYNFRINLDYLF